MKLYDKYIRKPFNKKPAGEKKYPVPWDGRLGEQGRLLSGIACFHRRLKMRGIQQASS